MLQPLIRTNHLHDSDHIASVMLSRQLRTTLIKTRLWSGTKVPPWQSLHQLPGPAGIELHKGLLQSFAGTGGHYPHTWLGVSQVMALHTQQSLPSPCLACMDYMTDIHENPSKTWNSAFPLWNDPTHCASPYDCSVFGVFGIWSLRTCGCGCALWLDVPWLLYLLLRKHMV